MPSLLDRLKRIVSSEPDLTWLQADALEAADVLQDEPAGRAPATTQRRRRALLELNMPLLFGLMMVLALFAVVLFGPLWAPENPYLAGQRSSMTIDGQFATPPFPPMTGLPLGTDQWGRDILSMLLYGTRNTLVACVFIAMARVVLGSALGMLAAWNEGGPLDRLVMSLVEWTTALPALVTGMILISALGIQRGIAVFIVALCLVGWAEIAQYIRSEFMLVRRKPFIEGARAVGLDGLGIAVRHILPNILPALVIIAVLEMGAVLMILGELGFIGVFIGGGTWVQVGDTAIANIPDIPEWGAMMAGARQFARANTWMVFYPSLAFFLAVLGFNSLGEGLRRIVQRRGVSTAFILSKRMVLVVLAISLATAYIVTHVGPAPSYASLAQRFDAQAALTHVAMLTATEMEGRQPGTAGANLAAAYIAERFAEYGLEPVGAQPGLRYAMTARVVAPTSQPQLFLLDGQGRLAQSFAFRTGFGVSIEGHAGPGQAEGPLAVLAFAQAKLQYQDFRGLDLRGRVALCLADNAPPGWVAEALIRGATGLLLVDDAAPCRLQLAQADGQYLLRPTLPVSSINVATADAILAADGLSVQQIRSSLDQVADAGRLWEMRESVSRIRMGIELSPIREVETDNVLGLLKGTDAALNKQLVIVSAHYDGLGRQPDGTLLAGANDGPSGVATMLEILHLWKTSGFQPRRTVLFAAWAGVEWEHSGAHEYVETLGKYSTLETVAVVNLNGLARGAGNLLVQGDAHLTDLMLRSAESGGTQAAAGNLRRHPYEAAFQAPTISIGWANGQTPPEQDTFDTLSAARLGEAGQVINLTLITLSREYAY